MPSCRPLEFSSRICQVIAKFRSFKIGKRRPLNGSFNFMNRDTCLENKDVGQHFPHIGVHKSGPCNVSIFTYDLWSCFVTWPEISVMSTFYVQYTHTFALHYNKSNTGVIGRLQRTCSIFFKHALSRLRATMCITFEMNLIPPQYHPGPDGICTNSIRYGEKRNDMRSATRVHPRTPIMEYRLWWHPEGGSPARSKYHLLHRQYPGGYSSGQYSQARVEGEHCLWGYDPLDLVGILVFVQF